MIKQDLQYSFYNSTKINDEQFFSGFGTKKLPLSENNESVKQLLHDLQIISIGSYISKQVHSTKIKIIKEGNETSTEEDGIITNKKNIALIVKTADCVPIMYVDKHAGIIGISHQGWRGTYEEMAKHMIWEMIKAGAKLENLQVAIGPGIGLCCFEVKDEVFSKFKDKFKRFGETMSIIQNGKKFLNLLEINFKLLKESGLKKSQIDFHPFCTFCNEKQFFSYRRDYHTNYELFNEQLSFIIKR